MYGTKQCGNHYMDGDKFLNSIESIINSSDSAAEAGLLTIITTLSEF